MPEICRFFGIVVFMNYNDHEPPHFHARYQDQEVTVEIKTGILQGKMLKRALRMVLEWYEMCQAELLGNWERTRERKPLQSIPPLTYGENYVLAYHRSYLFRKLYIKSRIQR